MKRLLISLIFLIGLLVQPAMSEGIRVKTYDVFGCDYYCQEVEECSQQGDIIFCVSTGEYDLMRSCEDSTTSVARFSNYRRCARNIP